MYKVKIDHCDLKQIADSGQTFRWKRINDNTYRIIAFDKCLYISQDGDEFTLSCDEEEWFELWYDYFDCDTDYNQIEELIMSDDDEYLKNAFNLGSGIRILKQDLFEMIITFMISQNNNIPRIRNSVEKLCKYSDNSLKKSIDKKIDLDEDVYGFLRIEE